MRHEWVSILIDKFPATRFRLESEDDADRWFAEINASLGKSYRVGEQELLSVVRFGGRQYQAEAFRDGVPQEALVRWVRDYRKHNVEAARSSKRMDRFAAAKERIRNCADPARRWDMICDYYDTEGPGFAGELKLMAAELPDGIQQPDIGPLKDFVCRIGREGVPPLGQGWRWIKDGELVRCTDEYWESETKDWVVYGEMAFIQDEPYRYRWNKHSFARRRTE